MVVRNKARGGEGGTDWGDSMFKSDTPVKQLDFWAGPSSGDPQYEVLKGLRITWEQGKPEERGTTTEGDRVYHKGFSFHDNRDKVQKMNIKAADNRFGRADHLEFDAEDEPPFDMGGNGGAGPYQQDLGNGILLGFIGAAGPSGGDIDRIGAVFHD